VIASRSNRRSVRIAAACALLGGSAALSACGAGLITQTAQQVPAIAGANATSPDGKIALRDVFVPYNSTAGYAAGAAAPVVVRIFNDREQAVRLVRVTAEGAARVLLAGGASAGEAPTESATPDATARAATPTPGAAQPAGQDNFTIDVAASSYALLVPGQGQYLWLVGLTQPLTPGQSISLTFTFDDGTRIDIDAPVGLPATPLPRPSPAELGPEE
jgi:copper(I)-binding protein